MPDTTQKRKRPPTFQHYPKKRAKALKAQWVQKAKIKSKWKAQKRKEGLLRPRPVHEKDQSDAEQEIGEEEDSLKTSDTASETSVNEKGLEDTTSELDPEPVPPLQDDHRRQKGTISHKSPIKSTKKHVGGLKGRPDMREESSEPVPSLRDRTRAAYSPATLHTYKSTLFQKGGRGQERPTGTRGRGQPNMKLRMGVMLEKIKARYS